MSASDGERSPKRQRLESYSPASPALTDSRPFAAVQPHTPPPSVRMSPSWQSNSSSNAQSQSQTQSSQSSRANATFPTPPSTAGFPGSSSGKGAAGIDGLGNERQLFKLCTTPIAPSQPHPHQNLFQVYELQRIQASVARRDPVTGEKINKLRKSYEGKVKALGLEGRNKAQSNQKELEGLADAGWDMLVGEGQTLWDERHAEFKLGDPKSEADLLARLDLSLTFEPGRLPHKEHEQWKHSLGLDDSNVPGLGAKTPIPSGIARSGPTASVIAKTAPAVSAHTSAPASPRGIARPDRSGKKRRYDESSYTGYQEAYDEDGYSTGGIDDTRRNGSNKRQKRKDFPSGVNSPAFSAGSSPSNGNMVGVRGS